MKIPFDESIGTFFRTHHRRIFTLCSPCLFGSNNYVFSMGALCLFTTVCDTINLYKNKLCTTTLSSLEPNLCPTLLRNLRLTFSSGYCFMYVLIMIGAATEYPVMLMPYLAVQLITITLYTVLLVIVSFKNVQCLKGSMLLAYGFMIHNWVQCFCCFRLMLQSSDF